MSRRDEEEGHAGTLPQHIRIEPHGQIQNGPQQAFLELPGGGRLTKDQNQATKRPRDDNLAERDSGSNTTALVQTFSPSVGVYFGPEISRAAQPYSSGSNYTTPGFDDDVLDGDFGLMLNLEDYDDITSGEEITAVPYPGSSQLLLGTHASRVPTASIMWNDRGPELHPLNQGQSNVFSPLTAIQLDMTGSSAHTDFRSGRPQHTASDHSRNDLAQENFDVKISPIDVGLVDPLHPLRSERMVASDNDVKASFQTHLTMAKSHFAAHDKPSTMSKQSSLQGAARISKESSCNDADPQLDISSRPGNVRSEDDGSWQGNANAGPAGVGPEARRSLNADTVPSLQDQEKQRLLSSRKIEVERWLVTSETESETTQIPTGVMTVNHRETDNDTMPASGNLAGEEDRLGDNHDENDGDYNSSNIDTEILPLAYADETVHGSNHEETYEAQEAHNRRPWIDSPLDHLSEEMKAQPPSSNAAIRRFMERAKDIETASFTATIGSRRRSEADLNSLFSAPAISVRVPTIREEISKDNEARRPSLFARVMPRRSSSNVKKRKGDQPSQETSPAPLMQTRKESQSSLSATRRMGDWVHPKSPKVDTPIASVRTTTSPASSTTLIRPFSFALGKDGIRRSRSRSDIGRTPGIAERWAMQGGPPVPTLKPASQDFDALDQYDHLYNPKLTGQNSEDDADGEEDGSPGASVSTMLHDQRKPLAPTHEGFKAHVQQLYPQLPPFLVERVAQEQLRRYNRLVALKITHIQSSNDGHCKSGNLCGALGRGRQDLPSSNSNQIKALGPITFHVTTTDLGQVVTALPPWESAATPIFSDGMSQRPLHQLPAEFECSVCFQVKRMSKPSDWTKHMHEDLQPFACTFPNCGEPKAFKRKADWVRHENECHRHLESWVCNFPDCPHVCYRKDNYVQHLVREHKQPEPRVRASATANDDQGIVAHLVNSCRHDTTKKPNDEPCRFCGTLCSTWKKLTVHLAKHMEHISWPILTLVDQAELNPDMIRSSVDEDLSLTHAHRSVYTTVTPAPDKEKGKKPRSSIASSPSNEVMKTDQSSGGIPISVKPRVLKDHYTSNIQSYQGHRNLQSPNQAQQYWTSQSVPSYAYDAVTSPTYPDGSRQDLYPEHYEATTNEMQPVQAMYLPDLYTPTSRYHQSLPPSPQDGANSQGPSFVSSPIVNIHYGQFSASPPIDINSSSILWDPQQSTYQDEAFTTYNGYDFQNVSNNPSVRHFTTYPQPGNRDQIVFAQHIQGVRGAQSQRPIQTGRQPENARSRSHGRQVQQQHTQTQAGPSFMP